jgi:hypothetical protein
MKLFAASLERNGASEDNSFVSNIVPDPVTSEFAIYPVEIPTAGGAWFENVTTEEVDAAGYTIFPAGTFDKYMNADAIPDYKYGYHPLWNVEDTGTYNFINKDTGQTITIEGGYLGFPKIETAQDVLFAKKNCRLQTRLLLIYNDSPNSLNNVKVRIEDQTLRGTVVELTDGSFFEWQNYNLQDGNYQIATDGADYSPANAKIILTSANLGNTTDTDYIPQEITIPFLDAAGTAGAWSLAYLTMYVTKENGNYAGTPDDYIILSTQTVV